MPILRIAGTDVSIETRAGEAILPSLIRTGYSYKFGCKRGGCGICKLDLLEGDVEYPVTVAESVLSPEERTRVALSCRAVPVTDTVIRMNPENLFKSVAPFLTALLNQGAAAATPARVVVATGSAVASAPADQTPHTSPTTQKSRASDPPSGD